MDGCIDSYLRVERVEDGLDEDDIHPTLYQTFHLLEIGVVEFVVGQLAAGRV